jgi:beta-lactamase class A
MIGPTFEVYVREQLDALAARTALYARHLSTGQEIAIRADEPVNTLSIIKIAIMALAYRDAEAGIFDLDRRYELKASDFRRGSGLLQTFAPGLRPTYRDLVGQMIITSDNTATDILIAHLGLERVNTLLAGLGYVETRLQATTGRLFHRLWELVDPANTALTDREVYERGFPTDPEAMARSFAFEGDPAEWLGRTTAREISRLLAQLQNGELASRTACDEMLDMLSSTPTTAPSSSPSSLPRIGAISLNWKRPTGASPKPCSMPGAVIETNKEPRG